MIPLWTKKELINAINATDPNDNFLLKEKTEILGVSINDKTIKKGDLFIPIKGNRFDGHNFIESAIKNGAAGVIVSDFKLAKKYNALYVNDTKKALIKMAQFARKRFKGKTIAITGSAGKTSTRYITSTILKKYGETHYSQGNNNNLIGVCLTLSRLPATKKYCVLELGMNHIGEIEELTKIALPNIALITNVSNSHIANFKSEKEIAEAKSEIFLGLKDPSSVILNADNKWCDLLLKKAKKTKAKIHFFGFKDNSKTKIIKIEDIKDGVTVSFNNIKNWHLKYLNSIQAINALAAISILNELKLDISVGMKIISEMKPLSGRGEIITINFECKNKSFLIDDSYNARPAGMEAALLSFYKSKSSLQDYETVIIISDMLELGKDTQKLHANLIPIIKKINPDILITLGSETSKIAIGLNLNKKFMSYVNIEQLLKDLPKILKPKQNILVKGSNGTGLWKLVNFVKNEYNYQENNNAA